MVQRKIDISEIVPYTEQLDRDRVPNANRFLIERHTPTLFDAPFHHHTSVEINFLEDCTMDYSFSGQIVHLEAGCLTLFWGAAPHKVADVKGKGRITNIYLSLGQFMRWGLPDALTKAIISGAVISAKPPQEDDARLFDRLFAERNKDEGPWRRIHMTEVENRLRRLGMEGYDTRLEPGQATGLLQVNAQTRRHVETMLRYIADNFSRPLSVRDIASAVNLSAGRATTLFQEVMGVSIKHHLTRARLSHARMLLSETNLKIVTIALDSGFRSLSSFYDAFSKANGMSPARYREEMRVQRVQE